MLNKRSARIACTKSFTCARECKVAGVVHLGCGPLRIDLRILLPLMLQLGIRPVRILFLSPRHCWPTHGGAKIREYHFLRTLSDLGELTYVHFADPGSPPLTSDDLPFVAEIAGVPSHNRMESYKQRVESSAVCPCRC